jgi:DNA ligase (NAD+)
MPNWIVRGNIIKEEATPENFEGKNIVFTGTMRYPRSHMETIARSVSMIVQDRVTRQTDFLVYGDRPGSKLAKAEKLGVTILEEHEFMDMIA